MQSRWPSYFAHYMAAMLPLFVSDELDPMAELRRQGVDARLAWHADDESAALLLIDPRLENLARLDTWLHVAPDHR
jgi:hypothetical protein